MASRRQDLLFAAQLRTQTEVPLPGQLLDPEQTLAQKCFGPFAGAITGGMVYQNNLEPLANQPAQAALDLLHLIPRTNNCQQLRRRHHCNGGLPSATH